MEGNLPRTNCNIPMPSYVKASEEAEKCKICIHKGVCAFSREYEKFVSEIKEKCKQPEYHHFTARCECGFFEEMVQFIK